MTTTKKTPEELREILQKGGLDECLHNLHHLDEGQQTQVRHLILDFADRALEFAPVGKESPRLALAMAMALKTARLYLDGNVLKGELEEAIDRADADAADAAAAAYDANAAAYADAARAAAYYAADYWSADAAADAAYYAAAAAAYSAYDAAYADYAAATAAAYAAADADADAAYAAAAAAKAAADPAAAADYAVAYAAERKHQNKKLKDVLESMVNEEVTT